MNKKSVYKVLVDVFNTPLDDIVTVRVPEGAKYLRISRQFEGNDETYLWFLCDPYAKMVDKKILVAMTGKNYDETLMRHHIGTEIYHEGQLALHFFSVY